MLTSMDTVLKHCVGTRAEEKQLMQVISVNEPCAEQLLPLLSCTGSKRRRYVCTTIKNENRRDAGVIPQSRGERLEIQALRLKASRHTSCGSSDSNNILIPNAGPPLPSHHFPPPRHAPNA